MLWSTDRLRGLVPTARDGDIGKVREVLFDDARWVIRYLVVATGGWLSSRDVLISPHAVERLDDAGRRLELRLSRHDIEAAPGIETDKPVSRQMEAAYHDYYGYPYYWTGPGLWGTAAFPVGGFPPITVPQQAGLPALQPSIAREMAERAAAERESADPHLRSSAEVIGYDIEARDGSIGHVEDFLFDPCSWQMHYVVVDTRNWLPGRMVVITPPAIESIDWSAKAVKVRLTREAVESSPPFERNQPLPDDHIERVQRHFESWL